MYLEHFGLSSEPFSIAPDPKFLFLSESHNEALAHLLYGFSHGGFVLKKSACSLLHRTTC